MSSFDTQVHVEETNQLVSDENRQEWEEFLDSLEDDGCELHFDENVDIFDDDDEWVDEDFFDDDGQPDEAQEWHDFDPDC